MKEQSIVVVMFPIKHRPRVTHQRLTEEFKSRRLMLGEHKRIRISEELARKYLEARGEKITPDRLTRIMLGESFIGVFHGCIAYTIAGIMNEDSEGIFRATESAEEYIRLYQLFFSHPEAVS